MDDNRALNKIVIELFPQISECALKEMGHGPISSSSQNFATKRNSSI